MKDFDFHAVNKLERALAGRLDTDRLHVMAQNPSNNHHWSSSLGEVTAADLRTVVNIAMAALMTVEREKEFRT